MIKGPEVWEMPKNLQGVFYGRFPRKQTPKWSLAFRNVLGSVLGISPGGGVKEVGLGRGSYWATIHSQKKVLEISCVVPKLG